MKNKSLYILIFIVFIISIISVEKACSQGFDWQYSARLPHSSPIFFFGLEGSSAYLLHKSNLDFLENDCHCTNFTDGNGVGYSVGIKSEYWYSGLLALNAGLGYKYQPGKFTSRAEPIPLANGDYYVTEYEFQSKNSFVYLDLGAKQRILGSHLHAGLTLRFMYLADNNSQYVERIISPDYAPPFPTNPPSHERTISDGRIPDLYPLQMLPVINIGYDLTFGLGMYATPQISIAVPIMSASKSGNWKKWDASFGISIYRGW